MTFENGKTYLITNRHGARTTLHVEDNSLYADNGAHCGTVESFKNHPQYKTLLIEEIKKIEAVELFWGCTHCAAGNWSTVSICWNCKEKREG